MDTPRRKSGTGIRSPTPRTPKGSGSSESTWSFGEILSEESDSTGETTFWRTPRGKLKENGGRLNRWKTKVGVKSDLGLRMIERWSRLKRWVDWNSANRWMTRVKLKLKNRERIFSTSTRRLCRLSVFMIGFCFTLTLFLFFSPSSTYTSSSLPDVHTLGSYIPVQPFLPSSSNPKSKAQKNKSDPIKWLKENSRDRYALTGPSKSWVSQISEWRSPRPKAALISLVRNSELEGMLQSMRQLEARWNHKYMYPWVFFNDEPFSQEFIESTGNATKAECRYEVVPEEFWTMPEWVDEGRFMNSLDYLGTIGVGKGWMVSYHHMCRWNSGFFFRMKVLEGVEWYWRVEPDVHFFCNINYDIFRFMRDNNLKYGFNMNILDDARSFPSLWSKTRAFATANPHLLHPDADLDWLLDKGEYNNCQFFSNFEIGSLDFWRGEHHKKYFEYLDKSGGFYYERWGDAPVHTLSVGMFLGKGESWWFGDVGYQHGINRMCPGGREGDCACEETGVDEGFYKLVPLESPQRKPRDTCIRGWLGGEWVRKREGWERELEVAVGGDGFGGYILGGRGGR
ncbi:uncharacterized protein EAE98_011624 [Botrytis deweyae]|uniref:Glycosyltransferase family 15 protein n=1 Tax=Botrytis deweyae TaxID=2478750 RepID=A0ABQ7I5S9_9HELO|nr:uncharacterized protein EAE98_011624 [Botrytis deweyae]KAF7913399.1 hypothetical protein EAE98_011624 [Botrytis deweyae]